METLEEPIINELLESLFPSVNTNRPDTWQDFSWNDEWLVTLLEVRNALKRNSSANTAPGIDVTTKALKQIPEEMSDKFRKCLNACLKEGSFHKARKKALLVLIPKEGQIAPGIPKIRPICLISEMDKAFEHIIASRLNEWRVDAE